MLILSCGAKKDVRVTDGRPQTGWVFDLTKNRRFWNVTLDCATYFCIYWGGGALETYCFTCMPLEISVLRACFCKIPCYILYKHPVRRICL